MYPQALKLLITDPKAALMAPTQFAFTFCPLVVRGVAWLLLLVLMVVMVVRVVMVVMMVMMVRKGVVDGVGGGWSGCGGGDFMVLAVCCLYDKYVIV